MEQSNILKLEHVTKKYGRKIALDDVSTTFVPGKINVLIGKNGSGKSTLMRCVMRHLGYSGHIERPMRKIGYAPQKSIMPRDLCIRELMFLLGKIKSKNHDRIIWEFYDLLHRFEMEPYVYHPIKTLSDGMKHKVNLMQALLNEPRLLMLDEPFANLDKNATKMMVSLLKIRSKKTLVIVSSHQSGKIHTKFKRNYHLQGGRLINEPED